MSDVDLFLDTLAPDGQYCFRALPDRPGDNRDGFNFSNRDLLQQQNMVGMGVFMVINGGGRKKADITHSRALHCDFDTADLEGNCARMLRCPFPVSIAVESSPGKLHAYWAVDNLPVEEYDRAHKALIAHCGSDPGASGRARVMRVPGFYHFKREPYLSHVLYHSPGLRYDWHGPFGDWLRSVMPPEAPAAPPPAAQAPSIETNSYARAQLARAYQAIADCPEGERNNTLNTRAIYPLGLAKAGHIDANEVWTQLAEAAAAAGMDGAEVQTTLTSAMTAATAQHPPVTVDAQAAFTPAPSGGDLLADINAHGADPAQTSRLLQRITTSPMAGIDKAMHAATLGAILKAAGLSNATLRAELEVAVAGQGGPRGTYSDADQAANAALFIQQQYPGGTLACVDEQVYAYTGVVWQAISDKALAAQVWDCMKGDVKKSAGLAGTVALILAQTHRNRPERDTNKVVFTNGILDMQTWTLGPHTPELFSTVLIPCEYNSGNTCPRWEAFLQTNMSGDLERIYRLQEWFGYCLAGMLMLQKLLLLVGPPRCGKGTIQQVMMAMLGQDNCMGGSISALGQGSTLVQLADKTAYFVGDAEPRVQRGFGQDPIAIIKSITGGDPVSFDVKYKAPRSTVLPVRITMASNHTLDLPDNSKALSTRFLIIPMEVGHAGHEDTTLLSQFKEELSGIVNWAIAGLGRIITQGGFSDCAAAEEEVQSLLHASNPFQVFVEEVVEMEEGTLTTLEEIYGQYKVWAGNAGMHRLHSKQAFNRSLKDTLRGTAAYYGVHRDPQTQDSVRAWKHLRLNPVKPDTFRPTLEVVK